MAKKPLPSREVLRQLLSYDPKTGELHWLPRGPDLFQDDSRQSATAQANAWNGRNAGRQAFTASDHKGYLQGQVAGYHTTAHRVIWAWLHDEWPECIDHIDGCGTHNSEDNLRKVTKAQNAQNMARPRTNKSGAVGVRVQKKTGRWEAHIGSDSTYQFIGTFRCVTAAMVARRQVEIARGYHHNHGTRLRQNIRS